MNKLNDFIDAVAAMNRALRNLNPVGYVEVEIRLDRNSYNALDFHAREKDAQWGRLAPHIDYRNPGVWTVYGFPIKKLERPSNETT